MFPFYVLKGEEVQRKETQAFTDTEDIQYAHLLRK